MFCENWTKEMGVNGEWRYMTRGRKEGRIDTRAVGASAAWQGHNTVMEIVRFCLRCGCSFPFLPFSLRFLLVLLLSLFSSIFLVPFVLDLIGWMFYIWQSH
jgi:hypothetical protein